MEQEIDFNALGLDENVIEFVFQSMSEELDEKMDYYDLILFFCCVKDYMKLSKLEIKGVVMIGDENEDDLIYYLQSKLSSKFILATEDVKEILDLEKEYYEEYDNKYFIEGYDDDDDEY